MYSVRYKKYVYNHPFRPLGGSLCWPIMFLHHFCLAVALWWTQISVESNKSVPIIAIGPRCHVKILDRYSEKLPPKAFEGNFYVQPSTEHPMTQLNALKCRTLDPCIADAHVLISVGKMANSPYNAGGSLAL